ncbi:MAG: sulfatase [Victivallales bacterium]|nr:sulfatase [Victivallales bacterium]
MPKNPNIVMFLIDDLGCRDLGCFGSSFYETPRLDALAAEGMRFTNAYASCPVCSPTRASIMSGKYPARIGLTQFIAGRRNGRVLEAPFLHYLPLTETSVAKALGEAGYQTWHVGKWHLGDENFYPDKHGFDMNVGGCHMGHPRNGYFSPYKMLTLPDGPEGEYLTDRLTDETVALIRNRNRERPFFLHLSHYAVHTPIQAPENLVEKYRRKAAALGLDKINPMVDGGPMSSISPGHEGRPITHIKRRMLQSDPVYAAMMENLDTNIGKVLDALDAEGLKDNTLVMFTSDNGGLATAESSPTCNAPFAEGKGWEREGGNRVCQIATWPRVIRPGSLCDTPVQSCDFYPTFLEAAGLPLRPEQHCDGISMMPAFTGKDTMPKRALFWHYPHYSNQGGSPTAWILRDGWKFIRNYDAGTEELFHLPSDVSESNDCGHKFPERTASLAKELDTWQREIEAFIPTPNPEWRRLSSMVPKTPDNAHE